MNDATHAVTEPQHNLRTIVASMVARQSQYHSNMDTFEAVRACSQALLSGVILQGFGVSAGNGAVIDWRSVKSGETLQEGGDAFDTAQLFVALVGASAAEECAAPHENTVAPGGAPPSRVVAFMTSANGGRRRRFNFGGFTVMVEPHEDDEAQAAFTARLVALLSVSAQGEAGTLVAIAYGHEAGPCVEHGREWVTCLRCGRQWAVHGSDTEVVTEGDGYCDENSEVQS